jgi:pimeloyl-ACP methyl ester carboxylesterase
VGWQHPSLLPSLLMSRGPGREAYVETSVAVWKMIGSPSYPQDHDRVVERAEETFDRGVSRSGVMRQMMAVLTQTNRAARLRAITVPTLVIHGVADKMVHASGGRATAAAIPGAELLLIDGMGHDLPPALFSTIVDAIERTTERA